jgi:coenzyme PQQ synthesis protein D (PqqD)
VEGIIINTTHVEKEAFMGRLRISDGISLNVICPDKAVLYDRNAGISHSVNRVGVRILHQIDRGAQFDDIVEELSRVFDARNDTIRRDATRFADKLIRMGLLERAD